MFCCCCFYISPSLYSQVLQCQYFLVFMGEGDNWIHVCLYLYFSLIFICVHVCFCISLYLHSHSLQRQYFLVLIGNGDKCVKLNTCLLVCFVLSFFINLYFCSCQLLYFWISLFTFTAAPIFPCIDGRGRGRKRSNLSLRTFPQSSLMTGIIPSHHWWLEKWLVISACPARSSLLNHCRWPFLEFSLKPTAWIASTVSMKLVSPDSLYCGNYTNYGKQLTQLITIFTTLKEASSSSSLSPSSSLSSLFYASS